MVGDGPPATATSAVFADNAVEENQARSVAPAAPIVDALAPAITGASELTVIE
jgi:hypothetical protein